MIILQDTKEKYPWDFSFYDCIVKPQALKTGDYTVQGLENVLCIERKRTTSEVSTNLGVDRRRFEAELERMVDFKYKYLIFEFSIQNMLEFPFNSGIPKKLHKHLRINSKYMISTLEKMEDKYGFELIYANTVDRAIQYAYEIMKDVNAKETKKCD